MQGSLLRFSSLLPKDFTIDDDDKSKSVERDGQLISVKARNKDFIKTIDKWMEAFHVFVAIYKEKNPHEVSS